MKFTFRAQDHGNGQVFIDDKEIEDVTRVEIEVGAGDINRVTITILPREMDVEGPVVSVKEC